MQLFNASAKRSRFSNCVTSQLDGLSRVQNEAVFGYMVAMMTDDMALTIKCAGSFRILERHTEADECRFLNLVTRDRLSERVPDYFVSDSALTNKAAVKRFMDNDCGGDDHWFPCNLPFLQLEMREAVESFLTGDNASDN